MSPEQSFGEKNVDHRTDIWSIGVMLYESLSGTRPIDGENKGRVLHRLATEAITPIHVLMPELPGEVAELVGRMLMRDPAERPTDLREVRAILEKYATVQVQPFDAATHERPLAIDSSPFSARSSPRAVMPMADACDPRATTYADTPKSSSRSGPVEAERPEPTLAARPSSARPLFVAAGVIGLLALGASATWLFLGRSAPARETGAPNVQTQPLPQAPAAPPIDRQASQALVLPKSPLPRDDSRQIAPDLRPSPRAPSTIAAAPPKPVAAPKASASTAPRPPPDDAVEGLVDQPPF
jgi:serine/threonine-protein kinase